VRVIAGARDGPVHLRFFLSAFCQFAFGALVEHRDDGADHFKVAEFLGGDVHEQVLAARIVFSQRLGEIPAGCGEFALRSAKLLEHQVGEAGVGLTDSHRVLQSLVVSEH
jgi:hypothetical protein